MKLLKILLIVASIINAGISINVEAMQPVKRERSEEADEQERLDKFGLHYKLELGISDTDKIEVLKLQ